MMTQTEIILWLERQRKLAETEELRVCQEVFGVSIQTALELARMGHRINRDKSFLEDGFFTIYVGKTTVFVDLPKD